MKTYSEPPDIVIIGAGAAGLMCGAVLSDLSAAGGQSLSCLILEKTSRPGSKLLISGNGHCNITHEGSAKDLIDHYGENGRAVRSALYKYSNVSLMEMIEMSGVPLTAGPDGRVFPASMKSRDILEVFTGKIKAAGYEIRCGEEVTGIVRGTHEGIWEISTSAGGTFAARNIVIATGGCSYPATGSDGSFFEVMRRDLGAAVTALRPALVPFEVKGYPYGGLSGLSIENAVIKVISSDPGKRTKRVKRRDEAAGALLFTHEGFSGPACLNISGSLNGGGSSGHDRGSDTTPAEAGDEKAPSVIEISYTAPLGYEEVLRRLEAALKGTNTRAANAMASVFGLPKAFCRTVEERASKDRSTSPGEAAGASTGNRTRDGVSVKRIAEILTQDRFTVSRTGGFDKAMVTKGGIGISEIVPSSFELRGAPSIYVIGEALDIDGDTGGYNLQFAFSSASAAANDIIKNAR
jgi:predicted Rossmann fold flavoprotein